MNSQLLTECMHTQATVNIGTIGHVAHGKSTIVKALSGVQTVRHSAELVNNITIKLGYANTKIWRCPNCPRPNCYQSSGSKILQLKCIHCYAPLDLIRHISFVDCPGHEILMATMLTGTAIMDGALLIVAANEHCPQPQTAEHLAAIEIMKLENIIIVQNKIDLIKQESVEKNFEQIQTFVRQTQAEGSPIVPVSAQLKIGIDVLAEYLYTKIPEPIRDFNASPRLVVVRSFDINKPGTQYSTLKGGIAGGTVIRGIFRVGDDIEIRPGIISKGLDGQMKMRPLYTKIMSLNTEENKLQMAIPGGLIGIGTNLDPTLTRGNALVGKIIGHPRQLPDVYISITIDYFLLRQLIGVKGSAHGDEAKVQKLVKNEIVMLNIGSSTTGGNVLLVDKKHATLKLTNPICAEKGEKVALTRRIGKNWRLIGWGAITAGEKITIE